MRKARYAYVLAIRIPMMNVIINFFSVMLEDIALVAQNKEKITAVTLIGFVVFAAIEFVDSATLSYGCSPKHDNRSRSCHLYADIDLNIICEYWRVVLWKNVW